MGAAVFGLLVLVLGICALIAAAFAMMLSPRQDEDRQDDAG